MLRGNSQLTADVILYEFTEKFVIFIFNKIIKTDSAADKYLLIPLRFLSFRRISRYSVCDTCIFGQGVGARHLLFLQSPSFFCFSHDGSLKFAVGPPTSLM